MTSWALLALSVTVRVAVPSASPTVASAMLTVGIGVAVALAADPAPVELTAHNSKVCSVPLARPVTVTLRADAPPATAVESPKAPDPSLYRYPYPVRVLPELGGSHMRVTSSSPAVADRFWGELGAGSSLSVIVTVAVPVPIVALTGSLSVTVKVSSSSSTSSSVIAIVISPDVAPPAITRLPFVTAA